ncbi:MAG TPA: DUF1579 family protein [Thermoanaerobaculia bacterium]|jgi:hypothetical protein|nr:DUF1579 family protein [Thermoanaerobaculia bacterium]
MMQYYIESAKPVAEHKRIAELSGTWKVTTKLWFGPGEPQTASGTGEGKVILGGRFLEMTTDLKGALESESVTIYGFDRRTNDFTMIGIDTLGTYWISAAGKYDETQKGIVLHGSYAQPPTGQETKYRFLWSKPSENEHLLTLYFLMDGKDVRVAETRLVR